MDALAELPDDPALLKRMLVERNTLIAQREAQLDQVKREAADQLEALRLKHQAEVAAILRRFYGPRNERFDPTQLLLFGQRVEQMPVDEASIAQESGEPLTIRRSGNRHKHGRGKLPDHLPRIRIEHDLSTEQKPCPCCGGERHRIGEEVSEQLEYIPAGFKVLPHVRFKYACRHCELHGTSTPIDIADQRVQPIEKASAGRDCSLTSSPASWAITCRCAGWSTSSSAAAWRSPAARCAPGWTRRRSSSRPWSS